MKVTRLIIMACMAVSICFMACSGEDGEQGIQGDPGKPGAAGAPGKAGDNGDDGADGINCWDTNGDGDNQDSEDINGDGEFNGLDCQGDAGADGNDGDDGIDCWDLNGNGTAEIGTGVSDYTEDINGDNVVNALDCQGEQGEQGDQGEQGNANVIRYDKDISNIDFDGNDWPSFLFDLVSEMGIAEQDLANYGFLFYLIRANGETYATPGVIWINGNNRITRVSFNVTGNDIGQGQVRFFNFDGSDYIDTPLGYLTTFRILAIENSTVINKNTNGSGDVMAELKAAGVDTSDYHAVAAYFGLEE